MRSERHSAQTWGRSSAGGRRGVSEGKETCIGTGGGLPPQCSRSLSSRTEVAMILGSGIIGYPLGILYPRNARYHVTPGDIETLWGTTLLGMATAGTFLSEKSS